VLIRFMSSKDGCTYDESQNFSEEQLRSIVPSDIVKWMNKKVYGVEDPSAADRPVKGRANSMEFWKKAISCFIPEKNMTWDDRLRTGNPTKSVMVNETIQTVKLWETRKKGVPPKARRPLEAKEFEQTLLLLETNDSSTVQKYMVSCSIKFDYHMSARVDDTARFLKEDMRVHPCFNFALLVKMCWSKNIREERDSPDQILLGAMDSRYCILLALGIYLEVWLAEGKGLTPFLFGSSEDPKATVRSISGNLSKIWNDAKFVRLQPGPLGTHSLRKFAATKARRAGCSRDDVDARGRWRKKRISDRYVDIYLPYPDAKVAAILCTGGPLKYVFHPNSGLTNAWLRTNVVPHIISNNITLQMFWPCLLYGPLLKKTLLCLMRFESV